jgi:hypothetical protein
VKVSEDIVTGIEVECPCSSLTVIVAMPPLTAVTVNVAVVSCALRACAAEFAVATVTTFVFEDVAVNVPLYPASDTVNDVVHGICVHGIDDPNEMLESDGVTFGGPTNGLAPPPPHPAVTTSNAAVITPASACKVRCNFFS